MIWKVIIEFDFSFLCQSFPCNGLKSILNIYSFFGTRFKIGDLVLTMTPLLGSFGGHLNEEKKRVLLEQNCIAWHCTLFMIKCTIHDKLQNKKENTFGYSHIFLVEIHVHKKVSQAVFTSSKPTMEKPKQCVKYLES